MSSRYKRSNEMLERARKVIPLGSQTFSKSFLQFPQGESPLFVDHGRGGRVWDVDGNEYVDLVCALMPVLLGYCDNDVDQAIAEQLNRGISFSLATELEVELAEQLVELVPSAEMVRYGKNGTDATSAAIRLARAFTGRDHVIAGGYHGWQDWYIGATTRNKGIPKVVSEMTHRVPYNDIDAVHALFRRYQGNVAALIIEPMNITEPAEGYLEELKRMAHQHGAVFIFDEVITGFRYARGGAQELFGVTPDLSAFGKAMGNGMPISAVVGRADIMGEMENVFISSTFGGEALSLAAALAVVRKITREPVIEKLWTTGRTMADQAAAMIASFGLQENLVLSGLAPWSILQFRDHSHASKEAIKTIWLREMLKNGVLTNGTHNICYAHDDTDVEWVMKAYGNTLQVLKDELATPGADERLDVPVIVPVFAVRG